ECGKSGLQARDPDGKSGRGHRLAPEARYESVVTPASTHRPKSHRPAFLVIDLKCEFQFVDRPSVVLEAADDGRINYDSSIIIAGCGKDVSDGFKFLHTLFAYGISFNSCLKICNCDLVR